MQKLYFLLLFAPFIFACQQGKEIRLQANLHINNSVTIQPNTFYLNGTDSLNQPVLTIEGANIIVDFNNAVLIGSSDKNLPNEFYGTGIRIKGKNITLKNARIHGFKIAVLAEDVDSLRLLNCDFSYNYRQQLKSTREREDFADWLSHHQNDADEWQRYGAAVYLKNCQHALVKNIHITGGQNGLMMSQCNNGLFYNNTIQFNSGLGIALYRSSFNKIMHNRLDWNVRGYSHGIYQRGQDSAGILVYEQSSNNTFAYNSATHSGDGFFLWAGQTTMDTGKGGCNDNLIFSNNFSYAPTNGIEATFSKNKIIGNTIDECKYGVWAGYSYETTINANQISNCTYGIAVEHGRDYNIFYNSFEDITTGIQLWERQQQPSDWAFADNRDIHSKKYILFDNHFSRVENCLDIQDSDFIEITDNHFYQSEFELPLVEQFYYKRNHVSDTILSFPKEGTREKLEFQEYMAPPLPDGMSVDLSENQLKGRQYILVNEWGPYDFRYPSIWLRDINEQQYTFLLLGPPTGNYKITNGTGWEKLNRVSGAFPATLIATKEKDARHLTLDLEFIGEAFTDQFGQYNKKGKPYPFKYKRYEQHFEWEVQFYNYDSSTNPMDQYEAFQQVLKQAPVHTETKTDLYYAWWRQPHPQVQADQFATVSTTAFDIEKGLYKISLTSDDGARLYLDNQLLIDHWDLHEPATDIIEVTLGGAHQITIHHFEQAGFGTLDFRIEKL